MAKERVIRQMTEEHWERIVSTPGVVVHKRREPGEQLFFEPRIGATEKLRVTASELIDDDDEQSEESWRN
jgi:hypothetical protein